MHAFQILALLVSASSFVTAAPRAIKIRADDVILYGQGRYQIMKRTELAELEECRRNGTLPPSPGYLNPKLPYYNGGNITTNGTTEGTIIPRSLSKRGKETIIIPNKDERFLGWDVLMSQVVHGAPTTMMVGSGYSIANSISVGASLSLGPISEFLTAGFSIDYSKTWTSSQSESFTHEVPKGKYAAFVSNPWTNRKSGNVWSGNIGGEGSLSYYQADSFDSKGWGNMQWVDGVISVCTGDSAPLKRCLGEGTL
ncbi:hypothetical protein CC80DRAFT_522518 [Byssothecium circinans]|uniref:Celp0028 effector like protein n=1 Tax=Byssothecium circinans TaxID=147558 RepID=A0A6A5UAZ0_9PLEO|nr:hypothetical protein CC80DRAFT_522518 [Byssothecium circinans]